MATTSAALEATFWNDVDWFNTDAFPNPPSTQYDRFNGDIRMKQIDDPGKYHTGKSEVENYFQGKGNTDKAKFTPDKSAANPGQPNSGQPNFQVAGALGFVSGTANFIYSTVVSDPKTRRIAYSFTYTGVTGDWRAVYLWGMYID